MLKLKTTVAIAGAFATLGNVNPNIISFNNVETATVNSFNNYIQKVDECLGFIENNIESNIKSINILQSKIDSNNTLINNLDNNITNYNNEIETLENKLNNLKNNGSSALTSNEIEQSSPYANQLVPKEIDANGETFIQLQYNLEREAVAYYLNNGTENLSSFTNAKEELLNTELSS